MSFEVDSWVWMEDEEEKFLPAQVAKSSFKPGEDGVVKTEDGEVSRPDAKELRFALAQP